jgi:hypothetical protein
MALCKCGADVSESFLSPSSRWSDHTVVPVDTCHAGPQTGGNCSDLSSDNQLKLRQINRPLN